MVTEAQGAPSQPVRWRPGTRSCASPSPQAWNREPRWPRAGGGQPRSGREREGTFLLRLILPPILAGRSLPSLYDPNSSLLLKPPQMHPEIPCGQLPGIPEPSQDGTQIDHLMTMIKNVRKAEDAEAAPPPHSVETFSERRSEGCHEAWGKKCP